MGFNCFGKMDKNTDDEGDQDDMNKINKRIDADIKAEKKRLRNMIKILLLGCGEAGKTTFIKQMRIIQNPGEDMPWSAEELTDIRRNVLRNAIECLQVLLDEVGEQPLQEGLGNTADRVRKLDKEKEQDQARLWEWRDTLQDIWKDPAIVETYNRRNEFHLPDCCRHFLSDITRISNPDFKPTTEDVLMVRVRTIGVVEYSFPLKFRENLTKDCIFIDVGGQRNERKKWIHCFSDVLMVMFLAAASEYDQALVEDISENRMDESLSLFKTIISYHWFSKSSICLFLNKKDLLEEKIKTSPMEVYFPEFEKYAGCNCCKSKGFVSRDFRAAMDFIKHLFREQHREVEDSDDFQDIILKEGGSKRPLYVHETCATDTNNIKKVFESVQDTIFKMIMAQAGMDLE